MVTDDTVKVLLPALALRTKCSALLPSALDVSYAGSSLHRVQDPHMNYWGVNKFEAVMNAALDAAG